MGEPQEPKRLMIGAIVAGVVAMVVWAGYSLLLPYSTLSIFVDDVREMLGAPVDRGFVVTLARMQRLANRGRIDKAIQIGRDYVDRHPTDDLTSRVVAVLYLRKAEADTANAEKHISEAMRYRDIAVKNASDQPGMLVPLAELSEYAGDLSAKQQCVQYKNAVTLLTAALSLIHERQDLIARHIKVREEDVVQTEKLKSDMGNAELRLTKVQQKLAGACGVAK